jgi:hypothetical protein
MEKGGRAGSDVICTRDLFNVLRLINGPLSASSGMHSDFSKEHKFVQSPNLQRARIEECDE